MKLERYKIARKEVKQAIYRHRCQQLNDLATSNNPQQFYRYINNRIKPTSSIHQLIDFNGLAVENDYDIAELLNSSFAANFTPSASTISISDFALNENGFRINITYEDVLNTLVHMPSSAAGPDGLKGEILRTIAPLIARFYHISEFNF